MLRRLRRRLNLSQVELATLLGCPPYLVCKWEFGEFKPSTEKLIRLLRVAEAGEQATILKTLESRGVAAVDLSVTTVDRSPSSSPLPEASQSLAEGRSSSALLGVAAGPARGSTDAGPASLVGDAA